MAVSSPVFKSLTLVPKTTSKIAGDISLAMQKRVVKQSEIHDWSVDLRRAADALDAILKEKP